MATDLSRRFSFRDSEWVARLAEAPPSSPLVHFSPCDDPAFGVAAVLEREAFARTADAELRELLRLALEQQVRCFRFVGDEWTARLNGSCVTTAGVRRLGVT